MTTSRLAADGARRFATLARLGHAVSASLDPGEVLTSVARAAADTLPGSHAAIWVAEGEQLVRHATAGDCGPDTAGGAAHVRLGEGYIGQAAEAHEPVAVEEVPGGAGGDVWVRHHGYISFLALPLLVEGQLAGVLSLGAWRRHVFSLHEMAILRAFGAQAAIAIGNARRFAQSERRARAAEALQRIGRDLAHSIDPEEVGARVAASVLGLIEARRASLYQLDDESGDLTLLASAGEVPPLHQRLPHGAGASGLASQMRRPLASADVLADDRVTWTAETREILTGSPHRAVLAVPLLVRERLFGVLAVGDQTGRAFTIDEVSLAQAFADQAAIALDNARLLHDSRARQARLETLLAVSRQLAGIQPLDAVLSSIAEACGRVLDAASVGFRLVEGDDLVVRGTWGDAAHLAARPRLKIGESLAGRVAATGEPLVVRRLADTPDLLPAHREHAVRLGLRSYLGVPVQAGERLVGVLGIRSLDDHGFADADVATATAFAAQAAIAVQNASLYDELQSQLRQTEALLNATRAVSTTLDPTEAMRRIARETAHLLGADMVGVHLADADGKSLHAVAGYRVPPELREAFRQYPIPLAGHAFLESAWQRQATTWSPDVRREPGFDRGTLARLPHRALLFSPMAAKGRSIGGLFVLWWSERQTPSAEEIRLLEGLADQAALSVETTHIYEASERRRRAAEVLLEVGQALASTLEPVEIFTLVTRRTAQALGAERCSLYALRHDRLAPIMSQYADGHVDRAQWALFKAVRHYRPDEAPVYAEAVRTGRPVVVEDAAAPGAGVPTEWLDTFGVGSLLVVPLVHQGQLIGMLNFDTAAPHSWRQEQIDLAVTIGSQTALAIERAQLHAESERRRREAEVFAELARTINASLELSTVLRSVARWARELCRADSSTIALREGEAMVFRYWFGRRSETPVRVESGKGAGGQVLLNGRPFRTDDYVNDPRITKDYLASARAEGLVAELVVPIHIGDRIEGLLYVDNHAARPFSARDEAVLVRLAEHAAIALQNSRLFEREQESQRFLESTLDALAAHIAVLDEAGAIVAVNGAWRRFADAHGLAGRAAGIGDNYLAVCDAARGEGAAEASAVAGGIRGVLAGDRDDFHLEYACHGPGDRRWFTVRVTRFTGPGPVRAVVAHEDVSERKLAEEALQRNEEHVRQVQKMEAVGRLAGGIAHDFNNLLTVICGRTELLLRRLRPVDPMRKDLALIGSTAERAASLTRQLLAFSRKQVLQPRIVDLDAIVQSLVPMLQRLLGEDVELCIPAAAGPCRVKADPGQLEQVIVNLAVNARDAMPRGGRLTMRIGRADLDADAARLHAAAQPGPHVVLSVTDSGVGMDEATLARIFEPFFTTKALGHGTGLGLATVYGIVQQHQGGLAVRSEPGRGTTFEVYLPATTEPPPPAARPSGLRGGTETVLLVEDEPEVRMFMHDLLQQLGYTVLEAANGPEAIAVCHGCLEPIHLLLSDVIMPLMTGPELAERLVKARPSLRVLYMSGYTADVLAPCALLEGDRALLQKPFTPESLAHKLREILDAA